MPQLDASSDPVEVLLIGASGFVGSRILKALSSRSDVHITILARRPLPYLDDTQVRVVIGDLLDGDSITRALSDVQVVVNAASYVGADPEIANRTNAMGIFSLLRALEPAVHARGLIHVSTTAVYGSGPHHNVRVRNASYRPESQVSRTRSMGDRAVMDAGGIVIRPNLIYGVGDRWFIPGVVRMFGTLGAMIEMGDALLSVIDVDDLGKLVASIVGAEKLYSGAFHAADPSPVSLSSLVREVSSEITPLKMVGSVPLEMAAQSLGHVGFTPHQVRMLGADNYFKADDIWKVAALRPAGFRIRTDAVDWYKHLMSCH